MTGNRSGVDKIRHLESLQENLCFFSSFRKQAMGGGG